MTEAEIKKLSPGTAEEEGGFDLSLYWQLFISHIRFILFVTFAFFIVASVYFWIQPEQYTAQTTLFFEDPANQAYMNILGYKGPLDFPRKDESFFATQIYLLKSDSFFVKLVEKVEELKKWSQQDLKTLWGEVHASQVPTTNFFNISCAATDPVLAPKITNTLASLYVEDKNLQTLSKVKEFADAVLKGERRNDDETMNILAKLIEVGPEMANLRRQRDALQGEYARLSLVYLDGHPKLKSIKTQLDDVQEKLQQGVRQMMQRWKDSMSLPYAFPRVRIFQYAQIPDRAVGASKAKGILTWTLVGFVFGCGIVFARDFLQPTLKTEEEMISHTDLPSFGTLPKVKRADQLFDFERQSPELRDSFEYIKAAVSFILPEKGPYALLVASAFSLEGRSTVASNLAVRLAGDGLGTLLIDGDLRRPRQHQIFKLPPAPGLTDYLNGKCLLEGILHKPETALGLDVICAGASAANPAELFGSRKFSELMDVLKKRYERILIDSPPLFQVADGIVLSKSANGTLFVINGAKSDKKAVKKLVHHFQQMRNNAVGCILNFRRR